MKPQPKGFNENHTPSCDMSDLISPKAKRTKVVHCGKEEYDVLVDRSTIFGNPFVIGVDGTRREVIEKYRQWVNTQPELLKEIRKLQGKTLGCWCKPKHACHADVIAGIADIDDIFW
jgi:hypothetical protein